MKVLLTGATGFVGRNLLLDLLQDTSIERIAACVRHGGKLVSLLAEEGICGVPEKLEILSGTDRDWGVNRLPFAPDVAVHSAGVLFAHKAKDYYTCNVDGTRRLISELPESCRIVVLSSQSAAGPTPSDIQARSEATPCAPLSEYGKSKKQMEEMLALEFSAPRDIVILRPPMVLGPRDSATIPLFKMASGWVWVKPGEKIKRLSWISVNDLVSALRAVMNNPLPSRRSSGWPTYFVSSQPSITDEELIQATAEVLHSKGILIALPDVILRLVGVFSQKIPAIGRAVPSLQPDRLRELMEWHWTVTDAAFRSAYSWHSKSSLHETLREAALWLQSQGVLRAK